jgi:hypothetical protein
MSIATKVKATGEFFHATGIIAGGGIEHIAARPLEKDCHYVGTHYPGSVVNGNRVHFTSFDQSVKFDGKDLEEMQGDVKLIPPKRPGEDD